MIGLYDPGIVQISMLWRVLWRKRYTSKEWKRMAGEESVSVRQGQATTCSVI